MSVCIERTTHRSSTHSPTCEKISLTSIPLWPYFLNSNDEGNAAPVRRSVFRVMGMGFTANFARDGLASKVSTWEQPPFINKWSTRFAFAGCGGIFGAIGFAEAVVAACN